MHTQAHHSKLPFRLRAIKESEWNDERSAFDVQPSQLNESKFNFGWWIKECVRNMNISSFLCGSNQERLATKSHATDQWSFQGNVCVCVKRSYHSRRRAHATIYSCLKCLVWIGRQSAFAVANHVRFNQIRLTNCGCKNSLNKLLHYSVYRMHCTKVAIAPIRFWLFDSAVRERDGVAATATEQNVQNILFVLNQMSIPSTQVSYNLWSLGFS